MDQKVSYTGKGKGYNRLHYFWNNQWKQIYEFRMIIYNKIWNFKMVVNNKIQRQHDLKFKNRLIVFCYLTIVWATICRKKFENNKNEMKWKKID